MSWNLHDRADEICGWDDQELHRRYHRLLVDNMRSDYAKQLYAYESLPWWRRVFKRRPEQAAGGYTVMM